MYKRKSDTCTTVHVTALGVFVAKHFQLPRHWYLWSCCSSTWVSAHRIHIKGGDVKLSKIIPKKRKVWSEQISLTQINHQLSLFCGVVVDVYISIAPLATTDLGLWSNYSGESLPAAKKRIFHSLCPLEIHLHGSLSDIIFTEEVIEVLFLLCLNTAILMMFYMKPQGTIILTPPNWKAHLLL